MRDTLLQVKSSNDRLCTTIEVMERRMQRFESAQTELVGISRKPEDDASCDWDPDGNDHTSDEEEMVVVRRASDVHLSRQKGKSLSKMSPHPPHGISRGISREETSLLGDQPSGPVKAYTMSADLGDEDMQGFNARRKNSHAVGDWPEDEPEGSGSADGSPAPDGHT